MWEPRRLTNLWSSTACYRHSFLFTSLLERNMSVASCLYRLIPGDWALMTILWRMSESRSRPGCNEGKRNLLPLLGIEHRFFSCPTLSSTIGCCILLAGITSEFNVLYNGLCIQYFVRQSYFRNETSIFCTGKFSVARQRYTRRGLTDRLHLFYCASFPRPQWCPIGFPRKRN
jgi:hypothetical protein